MLGTWFAPQSTCAADVVRFWLGFKDLQLATYCIGLGFGDITLVGDTGAFVTHSDGWGYPHAGAVDAVTPRLRSGIDACHDHGQQHAGGWQRDCACWSRI